MKDQFAGSGIVVDNAIGFWIHRVYQASRNAMFRAFREHGEDVTPEQWAVLIRLWERDRITQAELSDSTFRDAPTMSRILSVMEGRGLVERVLDDEDGRIRRVCLTPDSRRLKRKLVPVAEQIVRTMTAGIDDAHLIITRSTLRRMFANLTE